MNLPAVETPAQDRYRLSSVSDLNELTEAGLIQSQPGEDITYPCVAVMDGQDCLAFVSLDDFYPTPEKTVEAIYKGLAWYRDRFDITDTDAANLDDVRRCQKFITENLGNIAAIRGQAKALVTDLEHRRMRYRAKAKKDARDAGETAADAEIIARLKSEAIDTMHVSAIRSYEETNGIWERCRSTLMSLAQDRKALQYNYERNMFLGQ